MWTFLATVAWAEPCDLPIDAEAWRWQLERAAEHLAGKNITLGRATLRSAKDRATCLATLVDPADLTLLAHRNGGVYRPALVSAAVTGEPLLTSHRSGEMPVWDTEFRPRGSGAAAAAALYQQIRIAEVAAFVGTLQRTPVDLAAP